MGGLESLHTPPPPLATLLSQAFFMMLPSAVGSIKNRILKNKSLFEEFQIICRRAEYMSELKSLRYCISKTKTIQITENFIY